MHTRSASSSSARSKHATANSKKSNRPARRAAQARPKSAAGPKKAQGKGKVAGESDWAAREKRLIQLFGQTTPKGKVLDENGASLTPLAAARLNFGIMPFAPRPDRMNWIYLTHGMLQAGKQKIELVLHWKPRENQHPVTALHRIAQYAIGGVTLNPGDMVSGNESLDLSSSGFQHWLVCEPDNSLPEQLDLPGAKTRLLLLLGISDGEMQTAMRVKPELADGRRVLLEALKAGGIFPVSDPGRTCMTRRRDFNRLWETAFHTVKES
jgi:hypothetical protein